MSFVDSQFMCGAKVGDKIYASCLRFNALVEIDCNSWESRVIGCFPNEDKFKSNLHTSAIVWNNKIIFIPAYAHSIHIFHLQDRTIKSLEIDDDYFGEYTGKIIKDRIFLVPKMKGGSIWEFDVNNEELHYYIRENQLINYFSNDVKTEYTFLRIAVVDEKIVLPLYGTDIILLLDINTKTVEKFQLGIHNLFGCYDSESGVWILRNEGKTIYHWNPVTSVIREYPVECTGNGKERLFNCIIENEENVYAIPYFLNQVCMLKKDKFDEVYTGSNALRFPLYAEPFVQGGYVWCLPYTDHSILKIKGGKVSDFALTTIRMDELQYWDLTKHYMKESTILPEQEGVNLSLKQFIEDVERV